MYVSRVQPVLNHATFCAFYIALLVLATPANSLRAIGNHQALIPPVSVEIVCIGEDVSWMPYVAYLKGDVQLQSGTNTPLKKHTHLAVGTSIYTGNNGFVSILLTDGAYKNIQPDTLTRIVSSGECVTEIPASAGKLHTDLAFLVAAIRG